MCGLTGERREGRAGGEAIGNRSCPMARARRQHLAAGRQGSADVSGPEEQRDQGRCPSQPYGSTDQGPGQCPSDDEQHRATTSCRQQ